jgi:hypothetical protein
MSKSSRLVQRRKGILEKLAGIEEFVRGSVVLMKRRCTYPGCRRCAAGTGHPTWVLTVSSQGKTRTIYLGAGRVAEAKRMAENYRRLRALLEEACEVNLAVLRGCPVRKVQKVRKRGGTGDGQRREA